MASLYSPILRHSNVIPWLNGNTSFISQSFQSLSRTALKEREDKWGRSLVSQHVHSKIPWTAPFGEMIGKELCEERNLDPIWKPLRKDGLIPDWETDTFVLEVKAGAYYSTGSAHEKVLGVPFKYLDVPQLYGKPLYILCVGKVELLSRNVYGNLSGPAQTESKHTYLQFLRERGIHYWGATDLLIV